MSSRPRLLVLADIPVVLRERLAASLEVVVEPLGVAREEEVAARVPGFHGLLPLLVHPVGERVFAAAPQLEIVANCAAGLDNIDLGAASRRGITVTNTPSVLTEDTADFTWALLLAVTRRVVEADAFVRRGDFRGWDLNLLLGRSLGGATLGVVGSGRIGQAVLRRAHAFGMRRIYTSLERLPAAQEAELGAAWRELDALLAEADVVSLHVPLTESTRHLLDRQRLARMKRGAFLINTARGPVVDESALVEALGSGHLAGAGLDVFEREPAVHPGLLGSDRVVLAPHLGSATAETRFRMVELAVESLLEHFVAGRRPRLAVGR